MCFLGNVGTTGGGLSNHQVVMSRGHSNIDVWRFLCVATGQIGHTDKKSELPVAFLLLFNFKPICKGGPGKHMGPHETRHFLMFLYLGQQRGCLSWWIKENSEQRFSNKTAGAGWKLEEEVATFQFSSAEGREAHPFVS